jgi:hypothetical protein
MPLFETEDELEPDWFENGVDEYAHKIANDNEDRERSGFINKTDEAWLDFKEVRSVKNEMEWERKNRN